MIKRIHPAENVGSDEPEVIDGGPGGRLGQALGSAWVSTILPILCAAVAAALLALKTVGRADSTYYVVIAVASAVVAAALKAASELVDNDVPPATAIGWMIVAIGLGMMALAIGLIVDPADVAPVADDVTTTVVAGDELRLDLSHTVSTSGDSAAYRVPHPGPRGGDVSVEGSVVTYRPRTDFWGRDTFTYTVTTTNGSADGLVTVDVELGPMRGDFRIAVAPFIEEDADGNFSPTSDAADLADTVHQRIRTELDLLNEQEAFDFRVRGPGQIPALESTDAASLAVEADDLARRIDADVVVYGLLSPDGFEPEFLVRARDEILVGAEELAGDHSVGSRVLGSSIDTGTISTNAELRRNIEARTKALVQFVIGLSWYSGERYGEALAAFEEADVDQWEDADGKEILWLLTGNTHGRLGDLTAARQDYGDAVATNDEYARAYVGLAEVELFEATQLGEGQDCRPGSVDADGLRGSEETYLRALSAEDRPAVSNVEAKVAWGLGRAYLCMSLADVDERWEDAAERFETVTALFEAGDRELERLASDAYGGLALLAFPTSSDRDPGPDLCEVIDFYDLAVEHAGESADVGRFSVGRSSATRQLSELGHEC